MPWLTPDSIPEADDCRPLSIPASSEWLALVSGALTELTKPYNWQQFGALTVAETVAKMQAIVDAYYEDPCTQCTLPEGSRVIRFTSTGHLQELDSNGEWGDPTGDYSIPPPEARTGGTAFDRKCLASKNAVNVLHQLYENLADSWSSHLSEAEALTAFTIGAIGLVGFEFAPITGAIVIFMSVVFTALYEALAYLGADLWDDAVSDQIRCFLLACASDDAGVVTFDWECFMGKLNSLTNDFLLSETQLRLYLQVTYILYFIGGVDGLNLAGRTTEITDDNCDDCDTAWCKQYDATNGWEGWYAIDGNSSLSGGVWHNTSGVNSIRFDMPAGSHLSHITMLGEANKPASGGARTIYEVAPSVILKYSGSTSDGLIGYDTDITVDEEATIQVNLDSTESGYSSEIQTIVLSGTGEAPSGVDCA